VNIPKGYRIYDISELNKLKEYISVDGNISAKFNSSVSQSQDKLYINVNELYKELKYEKSRYQEFRQVINAAASFYESSIVLKKI